MKTVLLIGFFQLLSLVVMAQNSTDSLRLQVIHFPDLEAEFPGGDLAMYAFLCENSVYPKSEFEIGQYKVYVRFIVDQEGRLSGFKVLNKAHPDHMQAALDVCKKMPNWIPAEMNGEPVVSEMQITITFH